MMKIEDVAQFLDAINQEVLKLKKKKKFEGLCCSKIVLKKTKRKFGCGRGINMDVFILTGSKVLSSSIFADESLICDKKYKKNAKHIVTLLNKAAKLEIEERT